MKKSMILLASLGQIGCNSDPGFQYHSPNFELIHLADGVYACIHKVGGKAISNAGIIDNGNETIIFDCFLDPETASELLQVVELAGLSPIKYVVNSHGHNDHIRGNQVFPDEVQIISTKKTAELIKEWEPQQIAYEKDNAGERFEHYDSLKTNFKGDTSSREYLDILTWHPYYEVLMHSHEMVKTRLPDHFVDDRLELSGPKRNVILIANGPGHTESDMILYLPDDKVLFSADLVFNDCHPYLADGNPEAWKSWLNDFRRMEIKTVVPGHGPVGGTELFDLMTGYITSLESLATEMVAANTPMESINEKLIPPAYSDWSFERFFIPNISFMMEQMK